MVRSNVKIKSLYDTANLPSQTNTLDKYQIPTPYGFPVQTRFKGQGQSTKVKGQIKVISELCIPTLPTNIPASTDFLHHTVSEKKL